MSLLTHGDQKYRSSTLVGDVAEWNALRVEQRHIGPGIQNCVERNCTELVYILSGQARVRRTGDGHTQEGMARAGTSWLVPVGTHETLLELDGSVECLLIFLPAKLLEDSALADYGIDPAATQLAYAGGFVDPALVRIGTALHGLIGGDDGPVERIYADGLRTTLAAHLIGNYTVGRWREPSRAPSLDPKKLQRVLDFIETRLGEDITLEDLAGQACLSAFHFSRLFHEATGMPPHRYVVERRIEAARRMLLSERSTLAAIALEAGFGSQANFSRTFRKLTGMTPGQYRDASKTCGRMRHT